nr:hypothetical protein [uncultured Rhodopila sp.]
MTLWRRDQIRFNLEDDATDHPVTTLAVATPAGRLVVMATCFQSGRSMTLLGLHTHGETFGANAIGAANLAVIAQAFMELMDLDELQVTGGIRTTGANPSRIPGRIRFTRRDPDRVGR